jgi:hypothetical protein
MALISVAELLFDPDMTDIVQVKRNLEYVDGTGIARYQTQTYNVVASIQSASGDTLANLPDMARTGGSWEIITTFPLATATNLNKADTVIWRGSEYVVTAVGRFGNFANNAGHYEGVMEIKTISPPPGPP